MSTPITTLALGPDWLDPEVLISSFGLLGILVIVFAESGLLIGFFLPGDSLLFTAGLLTADGKYITYPLWLVCLLITLARSPGTRWDTRSAGRSARPFSAVRTPGCSSRRT